ncbi:hypothetical protein L6R53_21855 [Myxococcota bacterium]|nr:hypothetical protein [Myxococcota bacterium]
MLTGTGPFGDAPTAWGRLAAVRRTLEWVRLSPERELRAPYLGANCARLLDEALALVDGPDEIPAALRQARALLADLDQAQADDRAVLLARVVQALEQVQPVAQVGAPLLPLPARARLVIAGQGRGGGPGRPVPEPRPKPAEGPAAGGAGDGVAGDGVAGDGVAGDAAEEGVTADEALAEAAGAAPPPEDDLEALLAQLRAGAAAPAARPSRPAPAREALARDDARDDAQREDREGGAGRLPFLHPERGELPLAEVPGLDPTLVARLDAQGLSTVADLLLLPPEGFERRPHLRAAVEEGESVGDGRVVVRGQVIRRCSRLSPGLVRREVVLDLRDGVRVVARWVGAPPRGFEGWNPGTEVALVGEPSWDAAPDDEGGVASLFEAEVVGLDGRGSGWLATYGLEGIDDSDLRDAIARLLPLVLGQVKDTLPPPVLEHHRLLGLDEALRDAHFPANTTRRGRTRLAFEELFLLQLGVAMRAAASRGTRGTAHKALHGYLGQLELQHGIVLDDGQEQALSEIRRDLIQPRPMNRLLQGDVGAGKGLVALLAAVIVAENRAQVAVVCPDGLSAERRFLFAEPLLRSVGISPVLAGTSVAHAQADAIRRGEAHVVFGTQALIDEKVEWKRLGLVIVEERDRYGTVSPQALAARTPRPDLLVMTTAPIPASLSLSVFGEFDMSVVPRRASHLAAARVFEGGDRSQVYELVRQQVQAGHQAMVVFPVAGGRDLLGPEDARRFAEAMRKEILPEARVAVYASAMSREERFRVFDDFAHRRVDLLVSTTFIEDAPAVDNATVMVVEHADKHSLVRLYRLRGHLRYGTCAFVLGDQPSAAGRKVVELAAQEHDGFHLAELDLQFRGVEELLGDRAVEAPQFAWADPPEDRALLLRARAEAFDLARQDPELRRWKGLSRAVQVRWGEWLGEASTGEATSRPDKAGNRRRRRRRRR